MVINLRLLACCGVGGLNREMGGGGGHIREDGDFWWSVTLSCRKHDSTEFKCTFKSLLNNILMKLLDLVLINIGWFSIDGPVILVKMKNHVKIQWTWWLWQWNDDYDDDTMKWCFKGGRLDRARTKEFTVCRESGWWWWRQIVCLLQCWALHNEFVCMLRYAAYHTRLWWWWQQIVCALQCTLIHKYVRHSLDYLSV